MSAMSQAPLSTVLRHPLASKRSTLVFIQNGEETREVFELFSRYEAVGPIGQGSYGFVCSARDSELVENFQLQPPEAYEEPGLDAKQREEIYDAYTEVAIKKLRQLFENHQPRMWLCATREIQLMMSFQHDNVMSASDFFIPLGGVEMMTYESILSLQQTFDSVYVVMKKMDYTLREVLDDIVVLPSQLAPSYAATLCQCHAALKVNVSGAPFTPVQPLLLEKDVHHNGEENGITTASSTTTTTCGNPDGDEEGGSDEVPVSCPITRLPLHPLEKDYRKFVLYQIFRGVGYLHLCPVIHRDLKPENIMLDSNYGTCITDFGQGRDVGVMAAADYVQTVLDNCTQWYAAPETLTVAMTSSIGFIDNASLHSVDVWSIGCIAAEMLIGRPLFYTTTMNGRGQVRSISQVLGPPSESAISAMADFRGDEAKEVFTTKLRFLTKMDGTPRPSLRELLRSPYGDEDEDEVELITNCLQWDPRDRLTIQDALNSPYFTKEEYEPVIDPNDTAKRVPSVRPEDISEPVSGRKFLWNLFIERHPEVRELWNALVQKHNQQQKSTSATGRAAVATGGVVEP